MLMAKPTLTPGPLKPAGLGMMRALKRGTRRGTSDGGWIIGDDYDSRGQECGV